MSYLLGLIENFRCSKVQVMRDCCIHLLKVALDMCLLCTRRQNQVLEQTGFSKPTYDVL